MTDGAKAVAASPRPWTIGVFLALYAALTVWIIVGRDIADASVFAAVKNAGYAGLALGGGWAFRAGIARSWRTTRSRPLLAAGAVLLALALMGVASAVSQGVLLLVAAPPAGANQAAIAAEVLAASSSFVDGLLFVGVGGVAAPIVEELVFREVPLAPRRGRIGTAVAFAVSCLVFGGIHLRGVDEWPLAILYVGFAVALGAAYLVSQRNLLVTITAHVLWNGIGLGFLLVTG
ncbi:CPBP family intramembrane glutamic endopeptidase [Microbacterium sp. BLY]|uniref:CPBP family intramembrane glutamic endopeptidase n=1 Tax=Microbacterium sp. BLY TaxID=2823280 RepID=UPI001B32F2F1|nr:CPBP family intramembrane glutamic endopeptidase [Microbacterium sp. BLY]MBP3976394.1 CPBP family intramembrane metalloprotease [Microbacterium sp. BLY]